MKLPLSLSVCRTPVFDGTVRSSSYTIAGEGGMTATSTVGYDPATLALTGWWRANYSASPWSGTASAGGSGSRSASEATDPPSTGSTQNGKTPADFDGTNDTLAPTGTLDTYVAAHVVSGWALVNADDVTSTGIIFTDTGTFGAFGIYVNGGFAKMTINSAAAVPQRAIATGAYKLITFRYNGTTAQVGVNEAPGAAGGGSSVSYSTDFIELTPGVRLGLYPGPSFPFNGRVLEFAITDVAIDDTTFGLIRTQYCNHPSRYALSL